METITLRNIGLDEEDFYHLIGGYFAVDGNNVGIVHQDLPTFEEYTTDAGRVERWTSSKNQMMVTTDAIKLNNGFYNVHTKDLIFRVVREYYAVEHITLTEEQFTAFKEAVDNPKPLNQKMKDAIAYHDSVITINDTPEEDTTIG